MPPKGGLGRGLSALIPDAPPGGQALMEVSPGQIRPNPSQPRQAIDPQALEELASSIAEHGILQPLLVSALPVSASGLREYQLIAGERRWQAARQAGLTRVPIVVREASSQQLIELALIENLQRADLNPLEEAAAYQQLQRDFGLTHEQIAHRVGKSRVAVTNALRLLALPAEARQAVTDGLITEGHARVLLSLPSQAALQLLALIVGRGLSVRQTEEAARRMLDERPSRQAQPDELAAQLQAILGTKVSLARTKRGGRLTIHFYSEEELAAIIDRVTGSQLVQRRVNS